jgi:hypothetical protein
MPALEAYRLAAWRKLLAENEENDEESRRRENAAKSDINSWRLSEEENMAISRDEKRRGDES